MLLELTPDQVAQHPDNLRNPHRGIKELTASVAELGVLVPLIVVPVDAVPRHRFDPRVTHVAVDGSRRQAAARAAGLPLPCIVRPDLAAARDTAVTMAATGLARDGLTPREEAAAVQTMLDLGVTQTVIGRATGRSRKHIATAKKAATLTADIADSAGDYQLTLTDLATYWRSGNTTRTPSAGLADRCPARSDPARRGLSTARATRTRHRAAAAAELTAAGVTVVDTEPTYYASTRPRDIASLRTPDTPAGEGMTPEQHAECPGHVAHVEVMIYEPDPDDEDQDDDGQDAAGEAVEVRITYGCTDPEQYGHLGRYGDLTRPAHPADSGPVPGRRGRPGPRRTRSPAGAGETRRPPPTDPTQQGRRRRNPGQSRVPPRVPDREVPAQGHDRVGDAADPAAEPELRPVDRGMGPPPVLGDILGRDRRDAISTATRPRRSGTRHGLGLRGRRPWRPSSPATRTGRPTPTAPTTCGTSPASATSCPTSNNSSSTTPPRPSDTDCDDTASDDTASDEAADDVAEEVTPHIDSA